MALNRIVLLLLFVGLYNASQAEEFRTAEAVNILEPDVIYEQQLTKSRLRGGILESTLRIFCHRGSPKTFARMFETDHLILSIANDDYTQYEGQTPAEVRKHYDEQRSLFSFSFFSQKRSQVKMPAFSQSCIGIESAQLYSVRFQQQLVDFYRVLMLLGGLFLFRMASRFSENPLFYYITGVLLGIMFSFMLLIWMVSKLMPRRTMMYGMLAGGWAMGIYFLQLIKENLQLIVVTYQTYVFWYIVVTGMISFLICYRLGPPKEQRSKTVIKWGLQFFALLSMYLSSQFEEAAIVVIIVTLAIRFFPKRWVQKFQDWYHWRFPPKRRFLTSEEYYEQGVRETKRQLEELRKYANSPECPQWKIMRNLSDPLRFAEFASGESHLRNEEILCFESTKYSYDTDGTDELSDDSDDQQVRNNATNNDITEDEEEDDEDDVMDELNGPKRYRRRRDTPIPGPYRRPSISFSTDNNRSTPNIVRSRNPTRRSDSVRPTIWQGH